MSARHIVAALLALSVIVSGPGWVRAADPPPPPGATGRRTAEATPGRVSYINGEVSFWRPGAEDWTPAKLNTPLAPGDALYTGADGGVEIQVGPRAFVRTGESTQIGLDNQELDFLQFRVTTGHVALDIREVAAGQTLEIDTPHAVFTVERAGYYHVQVGAESTAFATFRGGSAVMTPAGGAATEVAANQQLVITGTESPRVAAGAAPQPSAWDRWNYERTDFLLRSASARYVPPAVYGAEALDQHGSWRTVETYGSVWMPANVPSGWVPYSTGRWIWDPRFGWTWLDDAPWGWAPYHYGRWVFVSGYWAWAPGPVVVRPVYSPALVVFLGGGGVSVSVSVGRPLWWAPLGWGEPVVPWWGRPGFVGVATWRGWGGPRVVNNVVVKRTTTVNVTHLTVYSNVHRTNAVVGMPTERFAQGHARPQRIAQAEVRQLVPVRGALHVKPVAASVAVAAGSSAKPPAAIRERAVVATRPPHDAARTLRTQGLETQGAAPAPAPRIVPSPRPEKGTRRVAVPPSETPGAGSPAVTQPERRKRPEPPDNRLAPPQAPAPATPERPARATPPTPAPRQERVKPPDRPAQTPTSAPTPQQEKVQPPTPERATPPAPPSREAAPARERRETPPAVRRDTPQMPPPDRPAPAVPPAVRREAPPARPPERPAQAAPPPAQAAPPGRGEQPDRGQQQEPRGKGHDRGEREERGQQPQERGQQQR